MTIPSYINDGTTPQTSGNSNLPLDGSSSIAIGDILISQVVCNANPAVSWNTPAGWTKLGESLVNGWTVATFAMIATASGVQSTNFTIGAGPGDFIAGRCYNLRTVGASVAAAVEGFVFNSGTGTTMTGTTISTTGTDRLVCNIYSSISTGSHGSAPAGYTQETTSTPSSNPMRQTFDDKGKAVAGSETAVSRTQASSVQWAVSTFALGVVAGGGGTSVALVGQGATASAGTLSPAISAALTGQAATASKGTFTPAISVPLTGMAATSGRGTLAVALAVALTGAAATGSVGTFTPAISVSLTGAGATSAKGSFTPAISVGLTGAGATSGQGSFGALSGFTAALTGLQATTGQGVFGVSVTIALTGIQATLEQGFLSPPPVADPSTRIRGPGYAVTSVTTRLSVGPTARPTTRTATRPSRIR